MINQEDARMRPPVRIATIKDQEAITRVINSAFRRAEQFFVDGDRITLAEVQQLFAAGTFLVVAGETGISGCVYVEPRGERGYLGLLSVNPDGQKSGLGSRLMDAGENYCRGLGCRFMDINVVNLRAELFGFYQRRGYVETGSTPFPIEVETKLPCHFVEMSKEL
jgi:GNAT superfamily N-acetyltransferase